MKDIVVAHADIAGLDNLFRNTVIDRLGADRDALKAFEVSMYQPANIAEAKALGKTGKRFFDIKGALGLNDSGDGWQVFGVQIEEGLTDAEDRDIADQLAHQCLKCVVQMKRLAGLSVSDLVTRGRQHEA